MNSQGAITYEYLVSRPLTEIETIADGIAYVQDARARALEQRLKDVAPPRGRRR